MGIEYIADVRGKISSEQVMTFVSAFTSKSGWKILQRSSNRISFLFTGTKPRPNGPEDFRLEINETEIYIVFYGGTSEQENDVMDFIRHHLSSQGIGIELEEP